MIFPKTKNSLGNYLMTLLSVMKISKETKVEWIACDHVFNTFFDENKLKKPPQHSRMITPRGIIVKKKKFTNKTMELLTSYNHTLCFVYQLKPLSLLPSEIKDEYSKFFHSLKVHEKLKDVINTYPDFHTGMHIRTFKATFNESSNNKLSLCFHEVYAKYLKDFKAVLNNLESVFLCCDDVEVIRVLEKEFSHVKIYRYQRNQNLTELENDFVEFMILSRTRHLYGTYFSTFSDMCHLVSENQKYTVIPENYDSLREEIIKIIAPSV